MSENYFQLSSNDKADALNVAATISGRPPHLLEKDIWVVWSLAALFESPFGAHLVFKVALLFQRHTRSSAGSPKMSISPTTSGLWHRSWSPTRPMESTQYRQAVARKRSGLMEFDGSFSPRGCVTTHIH